MKLTTIILILACLCLSALAQTTTPTTDATAAALDRIVMPTYVGGGLSYNQLGGLRGFIFGATPLSSPKGIYASTVANLMPVKVIDAASGKSVYVLQTQMEAGLHKTLYTGSKLQLLLGFDAGGSFTSLGAGGMSVSLATDVTGTFVYQLSPHWGVIVPMRGMYSGAYGGWNIVPQAGIVWKP